MRIYTDLCFFPSSFEDLMHELSKENVRQLEKWGVQSHTLFNWMTIIAEEVGSLAKAILNFEDSSSEILKGNRCYENMNKEDKERIIAEAIQVATLSLKIAEMVRHGSYSKKELK